MVAPALGADVGLSDLEPPVLCEQVCVDQVDLGCGDALEHTLDDHGAEQTGVEVVTAGAAVCDGEVGEARVCHEGDCGLTQTLSEGDERLELLEDLSGDLR